MPHSCRRLAPLLCSTTAALCEAEATCDLIVSKLPVATTRTCDRCCVCIYSGNIRLAPDSVLLTVYCVQPRVVAQMHVNGLIRAESGSAPLAPLVLSWLQHGFCGCAPAAVTARVWDAVVLLGPVMLTRCACLTARLHS